MLPVVAAAVAAVPTVIEAYTFVDTVLSVSDIGTTVLDAATGEVEGKGGENVVSRSLDTVVNGMDLIGDMVASGRDASGAAIRNAVSMVPVLGGPLAAVTDVVGEVVDAAGGLWTEGKVLLSQAQSVSNKVGARAFDAKGVESEAFEEAHDGPAEVDEDASLGVRMREEGVWGGILGWGGSRLHDIGEALGIVHDEEPATVASDGATEPQLVESGLTDEELVSVLEQALASGDVDPSVVDAMSALQEAGFMDGDDVALMLGGVATGQMGWDDLGATVDRTLADALEGRRLPEGGVVVAVDDGVGPSL